MARVKVAYQGLSNRERAVLQHLITTEGEHPTNRDISLAVGRSRWEVSRALQVLAAVSLIEVEITDGHVRTISVL